MMKKEAIILKIKISETVPEKFRKEVAPILSNEEFINLGRYDHHKSNRLIHSINVSYLSWRIAKNFGVMKQLRQGQVYCMIFARMIFRKRLRQGNIKPSITLKRLLKTVLVIFP